MNIKVISNHKLYLHFGLSLKYYEMDNYYIYILLVMLLGIYITLNKTLSSLFDFLLLKLLILFYCLLTQSSEINYGVCDKKQYL